MDVLFCARDSVYRNPTGALPAGGNLHLKIRLPRTLGCSAAFFSVRHDAEQEATNYAMFWCGMDGWDHEWWECDYQPSRTGIYWYCFRLNTGCGLQTIHRTTGGFGIFESADSFQLTVYEPEFKTPDWLSGGVIYQIFPDRFASVPPVNAFPPDRRMHTKWFESPDWEPDAHGEIRNNDYFGGNLRGIETKLDYLQSLGVTCLYLNPIFEAHSNHRYNTADYERIDPMLGTEADLRSLCAAAAARGIHILLDGVFNHTGSDSRYFNRYGRYPEIGAYQSPDSPYADWYHFSKWPNSYDSWWGFDTLPAIQHHSAEFQTYITEAGGISDRWIRCGTAGWRLDVVDELPDALLNALRISVKRSDPEALLLGEVWEDASNKESYGQRRRYLTGTQLDSVMNYPFRVGLLHYMLQQDAGLLVETVESILEHYPPMVIRLLMNPLGTHDTERALTVLGGEPLRGRGREWQAHHHLSDDQRSLGRARLKAAAAIQFCLPGVPSIYYGDEAGLEGYADPFNRGCYPWGREDSDLIAHFQLLGRIRKQADCLKAGDFRCICADGALLAFERNGDFDRILCVCNAASEPRTLELHEDWLHADILLGNAPSDRFLILPPISCTIFYRKTIFKPLRQAKPNNGFDP